MSASDLRIVSYNLLHGVDITAHGVVNLAAAAAVLADLDADIIALQEADRGQERTGGADQVAELADALGMAGVFSPALLGDPGTSWRPATFDDGGAAYGVGLLVSGDLTGVRHVRLPGGGAGSRRPGASPQRPGWDAEPRVALAATAAVGGEQLTVVVTHLSYLPVRAARQLRAAASIPHPGCARILVGDLNLPAWAVRAVVPGSRHAGGEATYPSWRPRLQMHHVLVDGPVDVLRATAPALTTSDHRPLVVDLRHRGGRG
ncbi:MAG TPA: endonuclease/exonuclease/phosphatase family protein [Euzebyales bacterium]|nr:endonuclease/exonuclease/phosphatase family protein [Euzebyales bacterium]